MKFNYDSIFEDFTRVLENSFNGKQFSTPQVTMTIKKFFRDRFIDYYYVRPTITQDGKVKDEYLYDLIVLSGIPNEIYKEKCETLLVVETELGGSGASCSKNVLANVMEDFYKVLQAKSKFKIMIGITDEDFDSFRQNCINAYSNYGTDDEILFIAIKGIHNREIKGGQIQVKDPLEIEKIMLSHNIRNFTNQ